MKSPKYGTLNLFCNLGSFKMLPKVDLAEGRVEIAFSGTLLLSGFVGTKEITGDVGREYVANGRELYYGTGKAVLTGKFRGIQWFGKNLSGTWVGDGVCRLFGEFDANLSTGKFWYDDPTMKRNWGTFGVQAEIPERKVYGQGTPVQRDKLKKPDKP